MDAPLSLKKYILIFSAVQAIAIVVIAVISSILDIDLGTGVSIGGLIASVLIAAQAFVKDHQRVPTKAEKNRLTLFSFIAAILISCVFIAIYMLYIKLQGELDEVLYVLNDMFSVLPSWIAVVFFAVMLIYWMIIRFTYGWASDISLRSLQK